MCMLFTRSVLIATIASPLLLSAQGGESDKRLQELIKKADKAAMNGMVDHVHAETLYEEALVIAPENAELNLKMGLCQINGPFRHEALPYLLKARDQGMVYPPLHYLIGYAHQLNGEWADAIASYEKHAKSYVPEPHSDPLYMSANKRIAECRHGERLCATPREWTVQNAGERINSMFADYGLLPSADGRTIWFTSRRSGPAAKVNRTTREFFEDIYVAQLGEKGWSTPVALPAPVNSSGNDATVGLTADGSSLLIYRDEKGKGDILQSDRNASGWDAPFMLGPSVNTEHHEGSAWITADGQWIYFTSDNADETIGGQDIFRSRWDASTGTWNLPENIGPDVNTSQDEEGVFLTPDGQTLYFSSKGHDTMGGYDIFRSSFVDGRWTKPENMGSPINSPDDDLFFVLSADGTIGWFSSVRPGGLGDDDIYSVSFPLEDTATPARP